MAQISYELTEEIQKFSSQVSLQFTQLLSASENGIDISSGEIGAGFFFSFFKKFLF